MATDTEPAPPWRRTVPAVSFLVVAVVSVLFVGPLVFGVPPYMDEMIHYHPIACREFPLAVHNSFRAPCDGARDLRVFGTWLPLRSYDYLGITASVLYYPFYRVWPDPLSSRLLGALCLAFFAWGLCRLTGVRAGRAVALGLLSFPVAVQTIIDTGPVRVHLLLVVWGAVAVRWLLLQPRVSARAVALALGLGIALFAGVEQKAIFLVLLPGTVVLGFLLSLVDERRRNIAPSVLARNAVLLVLPAVGVTALLSLVLFSATTRDGARYAAVLGLAGRRSGAFDLGVQLDHFRDQLARYFRDFLIFGDRVFVPGARSFSAWTSLYWLCLLVGLPLAALRARRALALFAVCLGLFAATIWGINLQSRSWAGHHVVLAWPYLLVGAGILVRELDRRGQSRRVLALLATMVLSQVALERELLSRPIHPFSSPDRDAIHAYLDESGLARRSVIVVLDWGSYYVKSLYGPREQLVVYVEPLRRPFDVERLRGLATELNRSLVFVTRRDSRTNVGGLQKDFPGLERVDVPGLRPRAEWQLWLDETPGTRPES